MTHPAIPPSTPPHSLTKFDLGLLAVRLFGLYFLVNALLHLTSIPLFLRLSPTTPSGSWVIAIAAVAAPALIYAACAFAALRSTDRIVRRLFPEFAADATLTMTGRDLQAVLFSVVGLWMVATTLPSAIRTITLWWFTHPLPPNAHLQSILPDAARDLTQILIGLLLFARAKGLSLLWHRLRTAGLTPPPQ